MSEETKKSNIRELDEDIGHLLWKTMDKVGLLSKSLLNSEEELKEEDLLGIGYILQEISSEIYDIMKEV